MKFTISDCISRINQALNYPSITYEDVSHFFDQAISELNTSLRIALPSVTEMREEHTFDISSSPNVVPLTADPSSDSSISKVLVKPTESAPADVNIVYYANGQSYLESSLYILKNGTWSAVDEAYGIYSVDRTYKAIPVANQYAVWRAIPATSVREFSLTEYLPVDWIVLFLIPYVCFKFAVRNGDNGALFSDEFTQGFQQLQTSYGVPNTVELSKVAHCPAYSELVKHNLNNLRKEVPVRAITEDMRIRNGVRAVYGGGLFENGGWGI